VIVVFNYPHFPESCYLINPNLIGPYFDQLLNLSGCTSS